MQWIRLTAIAIAAVAGLAPMLCEAQTSLYNEQTFRSLTADPRAYRTGDVLTVQVLESATAQSAAETDTRRNAGVNAELRKAHAPAAQVGLSAGGDFDGGGKTSRSNRLLTTISVTVQEVLANGDLRIAGEQHMTLNDEIQSLRLEGRIRREDIAENNLVLSSRIADARISYSGQGELSERQRRGLWKRLLDALGF